MQQILHAIAALLLLTAFCLPPQTVQVKGKVVDETGNPIPYATIQEKGTHNGTFCNVEGNFSITVSSTKAILRVQSVGYATTDFLIRDTVSLTLSIKLKPNTCYQ